MREISIVKNLVSCKGAVIVLILLCVLGVVLTGLAQGEGGYELISGEVGISGESSGGGYSQVGSVLVTDGNEMSGGGFTVTEESVVMSVDCIIGFEDFAGFAENWLEPDCNEINNWCGGADMDKQDGVDFVDLRLFIDEWLHYCPDDWMLR